uniref:Uncharacterized protein n=1 Tax=Knipowitschia caucasica TaxID=637954 RepID=A0AAV2M902_KNICA
MFVYVRADRSQTSPVEHNNGQSEGRGQGSAEVDTAWSVGESNDVSHCASRRRTHTFPSSTESSLCFLILCLLILCLLILCFLTLCFLILCFLTLCFLILCFLILCFLILCFLIRVFSTINHSFQWHTSDRRGLHQSFCQKHQRRLSHNTAAVRRPRDLASARLRPPPPASARLRPPASARLRPPPPDYRCLRLPTPAYHCLRPPEVPWVQK